MILERLAELTHDTAKEKGFWDGEYNYDKIGNKLALVHSEVTEVLEAIRKDKGQVAIVEEMSDVIIRLLDIYQAMKEHGDITVSLEKILRDKMKKNRDREKLHGNKF
jgi:NTP pyrophosphatase (non-canonical NTP hydrolase)